MNDLLGHNSNVSASSVLYERPEPRQDTKPDLKPRGLSSFVEPYNSNKLDFSSQDTTEETKKASKNNLNRLINTQKQQYLSAIP